MPLFSTFHCSCFIHFVSFRHHSDLAARVQGIPQRDYTGEWPEETGVLHAQRHSDPHDTLREKLVGTIHVCVHRSCIYDSNFQSLVIFPTVILKIFQTFLKCASVYNFTVIQGLL